MYTTPACGWCAATKAYFAEHQIQYQEVDVAANPAARQEMLDKSHQMGVPVIDIDSNIVIGFNRPRLAELLGIEEGKQ